MIKFLPLEILKHIFANCQPRDGVALASCSHDIYARLVPRHLSAADACMQSRRLRFGIIDTCLVKNKFRRIIRVEMCASIGAWAETTLVNRSEREARDLLARAAVGYLTELFVSAGGLTELRHMATLMPSTLRVLMSNGNNADEQYRRLLHEARRAAVFTPSRRRRQQTP